MIGQLARESGLTYVVTGASSGIGFAVASALLQQGKSVIAVARDEKQLNRLHLSFIVYPSTVN